MKCRKCNIQNSEEALFCRTCGFALSAGGDVQCDMHGSVTAIGACSVCGRPVCGDCSITANGKIYCADVSHASLDTTCALFGIAATAFDAELIARNLSANGIEVHTFNPGLFSQFVHLMDDVRPKIYVESDRRNTALSLVNDLDLGDFITVLSLPS
jgi:hypothetical protein